MLHVYPTVRVRPPPWDLLLVLRCLTRPPFEPAATIELRLLSWKVLFLVAITSARRVSKLAALDIRPPFLTFLPHSVRLSPKLSFLPKIVSEFHLSSTILLPDFPPDPKTPIETLFHTPDVSRALRFYLHRTKSPDRDNNLFVSYAPNTLGKKVTSQRLSKWIVGLVSLCYSLSKIPLPASVVAHSTRAVATSTAFLAGTSLDDICGAATWKMPNTFIKHYAIDTRATLKPSLGRAVLQSCL